MLHTFRRLAILCALFVTFAPATAVLAQVNSEADKRVRDADGRLRGYNESDVVAEASDRPTAAYFVFAGLTLVAGIALFKDARRTHLD
ncbi:MAG: hypothetical protein AAGI46_13030 [Planctomycetota bacterium]